MIYPVKLFLALLCVVATSAVLRFPLKKIADSEFVSNIVARAAKGIK
jgi:hypothetical protein